MDRWIGEWVMNEEINTSVPWMVVHMGICFNYQMAIWREELFIKKTVLKFRKLALLANFRS